MKKYITIIILASLWAIFASLIGFSLLTPIGCLVILGGGGIIGAIVEILSEK